MQPEPNMFPWASCQIRKTAGCACTGNASNVFPSLWVCDPDMHQGTCVTHVPWCMPGSLTSGFLWSRWRGQRSWHSRRMRNPQFYVSGKRFMGVTTNYYRSGYFTCMWNMINLPFSLTHLIINAWAGSQMLQLLSFYTLSGGRAALPYYWYVIINKLQHRAVTTRSNECLLAPLDQQVLNNFS